MPTNQQDKYCSLSSSHWQDTYRASQLLWELSRYECTHGTLCQSSAGKNQHLIILGEWLAGLLWSEIKNLQLEHHTIRRPTPSNTGAGRSLKKWLCPTALCWLESSWAQLGVHITLPCCRHLLSQESSNAVFSVGAWERQWRKPIKLHDCSDITFMFW